MSILNSKNYNIREKGFGGINGSVINIEYGDKLDYIDLVLMHAPLEEKVSTELGRHVTCAYWIINDRFNFNSISQQHAIYCDSIEKITNTQKNDNGINILNGQQYVDTNIIPFIGETEDEWTYRFKFTTNQPIGSTKIFVALISTPLGTDPAGYFDAQFGTLTYKIANSGILYYTTSPDINKSDKLNSVNIGSLYISNSKVTHLDGIDTGQDSVGTTSTPGKIQCSEIKYRTWSNLEEYPSTNSTYPDGWYDGGEIYVANKGNQTPATNDTTHVDYIHNTNDSFHKYFGIKEGRLKDVYFGYPKCGEYPNTKSNEISKPRWVFKRSRIMFTIPPVKDKNNKIIEKKIKIRYRVKTELPEMNSGAYVNDYKYKTYTLEESKKDINIVICPRDEGVLDNQAFTIEFSRAYSGSNTYSETNVYYFHTYQKPIINIAYPKLIRNDATGNDFRHAKILASNMYSNFQGENEILNKYVCDALNVLIASSMTDNSGIPTFVRFFLAEYKFGRTGLLNENEEPEFSVNDTALSTFKSNDINDYTLLDIIKNGKDKDENCTDPNKAFKRTAYVTGIYKVDGSPLLISGRYVPDTLAQVGKENKLWTYRDWDYVCSDDLNEDGSNKDIMVGNAWPITYNLSNEKRKFECKNIAQDSDGSFIFYLPDWVSLNEYVKRNNVITFKAINNDSKPFEGVKIIIVDKYNNSDSAYTNSSGEVKLPQKIETFNPDNHEITIEDCYDSKSGDAIIPNVITIEYKLPSTINVTSPVVPDHYGKSLVTSHDSDGNPSTYTQEVSKAILFRAGYIYLLRMRMFHGAASGAIGTKYGGIWSDDREVGDANSFAYGCNQNYKNSGYYNHSGSYGGEYPSDDSSKHGYCLKPNGEPGKPYEGWVGGDDGTSGIMLDADNDKNNETYAGFSKVDYSIIEPITPYTSRSNLITVHPTSSQIGANQWLSFNYRHLSKNIGEIEYYAKAIGTENFDPYDLNTGIITNQNNCFGKTIGGIENTASRIMDMYTTCIETTLQEFDRWINDTGKYTDSKNISRTIEAYKNQGFATSRDACINEKLTIYIKDLDHRYFPNRGVENNYKYITSDADYPVDENKNPTDISPIEKYPIVNKFPITYTKYNKKYNNLLAYLRSMLFYNPKSGCFWYNFYRKGDYQPVGKTYPLVGKDANGNEVPNVNTTYHIKSVDEPFDYIDLNDSANAIEVVDNGTNCYPKYLYMGNWPEKHIIYRTYDTSTIPDTGIRMDLDEPLGNSYRWQPVINAMGNNLNELQIENSNNIDPLTRTNTTLFPNDSTYDNNKKIIPQLTQDKVCYTYGDYIQTEYFYNDFNTIGPNYLEDNALERFTINELAGTPVINGKSSSGWPAMYTTCNTPSGGPYNSENKFIKYFTINVNSEHSYGKLYLRVPTTQDCENGKITGFNHDTKSYVNNLQNIGGIAPKINDINIEGLTKDSKNIYPLTRTTHYLYFKSWINTSFVIKLESTFVTYRRNRYDEVMYNGDDPIIDETSEPQTYYVKNDGTSLKLVTSLGPDECSIQFGNEKGLSEVYGEDNRGWGRCLSADDYYARPIHTDGTINGKSKSGGIEVPILTRYTPLLQPQIAVEGVFANGSYQVRQGATHHSSSIKWVRTHHESVGDCNEDLCLQVFENWDHMTPKFSYGSSTGASTEELIETTNYDINIYYPFIPENKSFYTVSPNGGLSDKNSFKNYYIDADSDPSKDAFNKAIDSSSMAASMRNEDFLGGYGICTGYTVLLVPSDPDLSILADYEKQYFTNSDAHWNYFKQPVNYFNGNDIFKVRSKSIPDAGPVIVKWNVQADATLTKPGDTETFTNVLNYCQDGNTLPSWWQTGDNNADKGRAFKTINVNFKELMSGDFETDIGNMEEIKTKLGLTTDNKLKIGLQYDLVIVPIYCNAYNKNHCYVDGGGTINGNKYGQMPNENYNEENVFVSYAGSNPFVYYNYLFLSKETLSGGTSSSGGSGSSYDTNYDKQLKQCNNCNISNTEHAIIFPNVDNELFNNENGEIKECPGFWLNNSFRLVLRMPAFRTKSEALADTDFNTLENASNGVLNSRDNTSDDFEFEDIQIHIGKITELEKYGWPYNMETNLNKLTSQQDLARAHIVSYKYFGEDGKNVFSKRLDKPSSVIEEHDIDNREQLTGGALNSIDENYKHRFVEVNLSNAYIFDENDKKVPIYTLYPEGYYIQFRWKSKYGGGNNTTEWSDWHGGSINGGKNWWGDKGLNYYVPVRNFNEIYTEFRNKIKESYPGSNTLEAKESLNHTLVFNENDETNIGQGTQSTHGGIDENSKSNPKRSLKTPYYIQGIGNVKDSTLIVPSIKTTFNIENNKIDFPASNNNNQNNQNNIHRDLENNHDDPYISMYANTHDHDFNTPNKITSSHQQMWEMEYVDYIIRNMSKLYYKPKHNETTTASFNGKTYQTCKLAAPKGLLLDYKTWGWDDSEYSIFDESEYVEKYGAKDSTSNNKTHDENKSQESTSINGERTVGPHVYLDSINTKTSNVSQDNIITSLNHSRNMWDRNKYYRKIITKHDFDELNNHLKELQKFITDERIVGKKDLNNNGFASLYEEYYPLDFNRSRKLLIGNQIEPVSGANTINNINHLMVDSNYLQNIWSNIKLLHQSVITFITENGIISGTKDIGTIIDN